MKIGKWIAFMIFIVGLSTVFLFSKNQELSFDFMVGNAKNQDLQEKPSKLKNPPKEIKAVYSTVWTATTEKSISRLIELIKKTELNAIIIDIKDYSGRLSFQPDSPVLQEIGSGKDLIPDLSALIRRLHEENIYVIARIAVFQDVFLAEKKPEFAVKSKATGKIWRDRNKLAWVDPSSKDVWNYILAVAKEVDGHGFDEINFDYIRFPSDGNTDDFAFPVYDGLVAKSDVIKNFFSFLSDNLRKEKIVISGDIFGQAMFDKSDLGIGQILEKAAPYFDFICPMVYPSHYAVGFNGFKNPAQYPYEVVKYSLDKGNQRLLDYQKLAVKNLLNATSTAQISKEDIEAAINLEQIPKMAGIRPWLQDFDMGADYTAEMVRAQMKATTDAGLDFGWLLWDPKNIYTSEALLPQ